MSSEQLRAFEPKESLQEDVSLWQERYKGDVWKHMVTCVLLNRTSIKQVSKMIDDFLTQFPTPWTYAESIGRYDMRSNIEKQLKPLGLSVQRTQTLSNLAIALLTRNGRPMLDCLTRAGGLGQYALDSYRLVEIGDMSTEPTDKKLIRWKEAQLARRS